MQYRHFTHRECEFFPCHDLPDWRSCLFCWCPLYLLDCEGDFTTTQGVKDCSACVLPHSAEGYDYILGQVSRQIFQRS